MIGPARRIAGRAVDWARAAAYAVSTEGKRFARQRADCECRLDRFARSGAARFPGTVLVDGTFDNPNYWARHAILRLALGLGRGREVGLVGPYKRRHVRETFARLGIRESFDLVASHPAAESLRLADDIAARCRNAADVLDLTLPGGVPATILYDGLLKAQRLATVDPERPDFVGHVVEALESFRLAREALERNRPDLVVVSHPFGFRCGGLAWQALARGIPVVLAFGLFGVLRYARMDKPADLVDFYDHPGVADIEALPAVQAEALRKVGERYLDARMGGRADDLAGVLAFKRNNGAVDRAALAARFGWDPQKPVVAVYASNWFDWPHQLGMTNFRDFEDWIDATVRAARRNAGVNWLLKPHPAESVFGGPTLSQVVAKAGADGNVSFCDPHWNNAALMRTIDALVTYHGTSGIEFAALGKPVLLPDVGKYHRAGFAQVAGSRADYLERLSTQWWSPTGADERRRRAQIYAGWWFCTTDWQGGFVFPDDSGRDRNYADLIDLFERHPTELDREVREVAEWWASGRSHYHTEKMRRAGGYALSNVT